MLARNPKTGAPIRIMQCEGVAWRDAKTLVWLNAESVGKAAATRWSRWEIAAASITDYEAVKAAGVQPDIVLCLDEPARVGKWLESAEWMDAKIIVVPQRAIDVIGVERLMELRINNMMCLEEMHQIYPFLGGAWTGTAEDAKVMAAMVLRFGRSFPVSVEGGRAARAAEYGLKLSLEVEVPPELWLVMQYYNAGKVKRAREIQYCLQKNLENPYVDRIVMLNEEAFIGKERSAGGLESHQKLVEQVVGKRLTYADVVRWTAEQAPSGTIVAFANSDIYLDSSWRLAWSFDIRDKFVSLLRWDAPELGAAPEASKLFGPRADSQDTWVFWSDSVKARTWNWSALDFPFGKAGCDNAINVEMLRQKFLVVNPALSLKTHHVHNSGVRGYDPADIVDKPILLYLNPTGLQDMRPLTSFDRSALHTTLQPVSYTQTVGGEVLTESQAKTVCTMLERKGVKLSAEGGTACHPARVPLYLHTDVFMTTEGLVYDYNSIYIGKAKASQDAWSECQLSTLAACVSSEAAFVAPLPDAVAARPERYVLDYVSKILMMQAAAPADMRGEFWCSKKGGCVEALRMFKWRSGGGVPLLSRDETAQAFCKRALVWHRADDEVLMAEQVEALRKGLVRGWAEEVDEEKRVVVFADETWLGTETVELLEKGGFSVDVVYPGATALEVIARQLSGAWGVVVCSGVREALWSWMLPRGAHVWELQSEMAPSATLIGLAGASGLQHSLIITPKGAGHGATLQMVRAKVVEALTKARGAATAQAEPGLPLVVVPTGHTGFFAHAGDSFREMARIWAARGYCRVEESSVTEHCWLGGIGQTLLYDRPTMEWLSRTPSVKWSRALFGNPEPLAGELAWTFWPRRPELVESLTQEGVGSAGWDSRDLSLVFYGRSENAVQRKRRTGADWSAAAGALGPSAEFVHVDGDSKYPFTHEEYLRRLARAKYGLCLAGYGRKCHREIECMAMGCVPIVAAEVDMSSYADAPREGVHYLRASGPDEAAAFVSSLPAATWAEMSAAGRAWWKRNASAEGSWALTKRLGTA